MTDVRIAVGTTSQCSKCGRFRCVFDQTIHMPRRQRWNLVATRNCILGCPKGEHLHRIESCSNCGATARWWEPVQVGQAMICERCGKTMAEHDAMARCQPWLGGDSSPVERNEP